ncbi:tyrosine-type recombinase/integrase [Rhodococcus opacus]|uniref:tyrosine-type recombinase/integrase n=1 Tax=Rhodococcus opacus TaxID=37919 RepID=UPI0022357489|nr:site-specific integrase [Rhodococcus opacus]UZG52839.1 site-specific integrase [Rhodococcus opacus]
MFDEVERDIGAIRLPRWGRVERATGVVAWNVLDDGGAPIEPIRRYLTDFVAQGNSQASVRSYAYALLRWWRWLRAVDVDWDKATPAECRDLVLWLQANLKARRSPRTKSLATAGTINPITRKRYLDDNYAVRTIRHSNAVVRAFYEYWIEIGQGPLINPVPLKGRGRPHAHHNPLDPFRPVGRIRYNPKLPKKQPREIPDDQWHRLFGVLRSSRDRALLALVISTAARAEETLGIRPVDLDWGDQRVRVVRKGTRAEQWLPASSEAFVWLRIYVADLGELLDSNAPLWRTLRRRDHGTGLHRQPLSYDALRKVLIRANDALGTNWTMHDLRHTSALRMSRDEHLSVRDIQTILGHAHLSTTAETYLVEEQAEVVRRVKRFLDGRQIPTDPQTPVDAGYDSSDLDVLFGRS